MFIILFREKNWLFLAKKKLNILYLLQRAILISSYSFSPLIAHNIA